MGLFRRSRSATVLSAREASQSLEDRILQIGRQMLTEADRHKAGLLSAAFWSDKLMGWAMKDAAFKVQLFRFIDAFPALGTPEQVHEHLRQYLSQPGVTLPAGMGMGLSAGGLMKGMLSRTISGQIEGMAAKFIAGQDAADALPALEQLWKKGLAFSVDLLGEKCLSDAEALEYRHRYLDLVRTLPQATAGWPAQEKLEQDHLGPVPRCNVSIKISALHPKVDPINPGCIDELVESLGPVLQEAARLGVLINFDMEHHQLKDLTLELFERCCRKWDFHAGIALQAYLRDGEADAKRLIEFSRALGRPITVRLVKGAYWDYETVFAEQMGWAVPVWSTKRQTDACFERMSRQIIQACPKRAGEGGVKLALGSHNVRSIAWALAHLEEAGLERKAIELQMLHGMADELKLAAASLGLRVREYVPVGKMIPGMAYLVRRLLENTSNESWLRAGFAEGAGPEKLLASPHDGPATAGTKPPVDPGVELIESGPARHALSRAVEGLEDSLPFFTHPARDFAIESVRTGFAQAVSQAKVEPVAVLEGPAAAAAARAAVDAAWAAFPHWRDRPWLARARMICKAAQLMDQRRDELSALIIHESGKTWRSADADVCEAIDFCRYYARQAAALLEPARLGRFIGELNEQWHQPRGVCAIISPWNFPLAICMGMTVAALVTGNTAIVKPAEQTPSIAGLMCKILWQAGVPGDALRFVPGDGPGAGATLVADERVAIIAFTGSREVGLHIVQEAARVRPQQTMVKKVIAEMGGKNAIIVDSSADLDEAVAGVVDSAFGYSGQKCSACSRVIVVKDVLPIFLQRLIGATAALKIGDPRDPSTDVGPVIDEEAAAKIRSYIEIGRQEGRQEIGMEVPADLAQRLGRPVVGPHVFSGIQPHHRLAREEIFGPVLAVMEAEDFTHALKIANDPVYKLTGGLFSRTPSHLEQARREFRVGNLYLNRGITGALVGRQPFGGFGLSGIGSKAGGGDYLLQFVEPRICTENTLRHGFAPGL